MKTSLLKNLLTAKYQLAQALKIGIVCTILTVTSLFAQPESIFIRNTNPMTNDSRHPAHFRIVTHTNLLPAGMSGIIRTNTEQEVIVEAEPCVTYHYYAVTFDGGMKEMGAMADHDPLLSGWEVGNFDSSIRFILRSESPAAKLCVIRQMEQPNPLTQFQPGLHAPFVPIPPLPFPIQQTNHITKN